MSEREPTTHALYERLRSQLVADLAGGKLSCEQRMDAQQAAENLIDRVAALEAEIERLRAALEEIRPMADHAKFSIGTPSHTLTAIEEIADTALKEDDHE